MRYAYYWLLDRLDTEGNEGVVDDGEKYSNPNAPTMVKAIVE
jgi:hypothetical protein